MIVREGLLFTYLHGFHEIQSYIMKYALNCVLWNSLKEIFHRVSSPLDEGYSEFVPLSYKTAFSNIFRSAVLICFERWSVISFALNKHAEQPCMYMLWTSNPSSNKILPLLSDHWASRRNSKNKLETSPKHWLWSSDRTTSKYFASIKFETNKSSLSSII